MSEHKVSSEFIKQAHKAACKEWKQKLESEFPDIFTFPKVMRAHKAPHGGMIVWMTANSTGVVIKTSKNSHFELGYECNTWQMDAFHDYEIER